LRTDVRRHYRGSEALGSWWLSLEKLNETLGQALSPPEGMVFYVLAPDGTTTLHCNFAMIFENPLEMDSPSLTAAAEVMLGTGREATMTLERVECGQTVLALRGRMRARTLPQRRKWMSRQEKAT